MLLRRRKARGRKIEREMEREIDIEGKRKI
jgi:hypothetical protein